MSKYASLIRTHTRARGTTFFLSSHILSEVERLAKRIAVVHEGRLTAELTPAELDRQRRRRLEVVVRDAALGEELLRRATAPRPSASPSSPTTSSRCVLRADGAQSMSARHTLTERRT